MNVAPIKPFSIVHSGNPDIVVVPCHNESKRFNPGLLKQAVKQTNTNFLFVNDGSTDNGATLNLLDDLKKRFHGRVDFISLEKNKGKAGAVREGILAALEREPKHVGFFDADGAVPFAQSRQMSDIFAQSKDARVVIATRSRLAGRDVDRTSMKYLSQTIISNMANVLFSPKVEDTQCGAKMIKSSQLRQVITEPFNVNWIFDIELLTRLSRLLENINNKRWLFEYPVPRWKEVGGSTRKPSSYADALKDYFRLLKLYGIKKI